MSAALHEYQLPFDDTYMHCYDTEGDGFPLVFLHGSGAGCSTLSNYRRVLEPLGAEYRVVAADLLGFGWSGRKTAEPYFDMDTWVRQVRRLIDHVDAEAVGLVGHSLSGPIVLKTAAVDGRVAGVITTATMGAPADRLAAGPRWALPPDRDTVRRNVERTMYDPTEATDDEVDRRMAVLAQEGHREHFDAMFGGDPDALINSSALSEEELKSIECPVTLMHGRQDRSFTPAETSLWLAEGLPAADVYVLDRCAHSVAMERSTEFMAVVRSMFPTTQ